MTARLVLDPVRLRRARLAAAMSQEALAKAAGVRPATISAAENGTRAHVTTIGRLAKALGVKPTEIADIIERPAT